MAEWLWLLLPVAVLVPWLAARWVLGGMWKW
jgi:hypothetical protein